MQFIETKKELADILRSIFQSGNGHIGHSKFFKEYKFWNATGKEFGSSFPTIYWSEKLEAELNEVKP